MSSGAEVESVEISVTNSGDRTDSEVVQVYLDVALGTHPTPLPTLAGFARVTLDPGETLEVTVPLDSEALRPGARPGRRHRPSRTQR